MKKISCLIFSLLMGMCVLCFTVSATGANVVDNADLLTSLEEAELQSAIEQIRDDYQFDVVILTVESTEGLSVAAFADDYYDYNGYGIDEENSGVLFLVSMADRDWFISTCGKGISLIADGEIDYIEYEIIPYLSDGDYNYAFSYFVSTCDEILEYNSRGESFAEANGYDYGDDYYHTDEYYYSDGYYEDDYTPQSFSFLRNAVIALTTGFVIALIVVLSMKAKLKTVRAKSGAADYVVAGSMNLTHSDERFLYRHVTRTPRQQNNSNGRSGGGGVRVSSSGRSHGGRGGKF